MVNRSSSFFVQLTKKYYNKNIVTTVVAVDLNALYVRHVRLSISSCCSKPSKLYKKESEKKENKRGKQVERTFSKPHSHLPATLVETLPSNMPSSGICASLAAKAKIIFSRTTL